MYTLFNKKFLYLIVISTLFAFVSCDNPTSSDDDHDDGHSDPFGVALILNGVEIAKQEDGVVTYNDGDHLEMQVGEETNLVSVRWIAEDGDRFTPDTDDGFSLSWIVENEDVLEVEQHEEDGAWNFHLVGVGAGESTISFELFHNDHADFTSLPFEVHVEEVVSSMQIQNDAGTAVVTIESDGTINGSLDTDAGQTAGPFTAVFMDDEGNMVDTDHDYELEWHLEGSEFAGIEAVEGSPMSFNVTGIAAGQAQAHFELVKAHGSHDDDDHDDDHGGEIKVFESPDVTINVN